MKNKLRVAALACLAVVPLWAGVVGSQENTEKPKYANLTFVPTADEVIDKMFELGKVNKSDIMFDLGCGDNRICFKAAKKFGCKGVGLDINPVRIREAMDWAEKMNVGLLVETRHGDALNVKDISDATVVVMYMFPEFMDLWLPIAKEKLKPGTRILSHDYTWDMNQWAPDRTEIVKSSTREHKVHMWTVKKR
jgi:cyclopropane fatty-acyl-phospholipid synthase-like methyltransferase